MNLRLIGDLHCDVEAIMSMMKTLPEYELTIQVGDCGIGFGMEEIIERYCTTPLLILQGNHDNPNIFRDITYGLDRFGVIKVEGFKIFYVAGAHSMDYQSRTEGLDWWGNEELSWDEQRQCLGLWEDNKDCDLVISHDCPLPGCLQMSHDLVETTTRALLYEMLKIQSPPRWVFGHWHRSHSFKMYNTSFQCLNIKEELVIPI
jgi:predicted phosphodiesterase